MIQEILATSDAVAKRAAQIIAASARESVKSRGKFVIAVSGGRTPWLMLRALAGEDVPWDAFHVVQVDERIAPDGDPDRNLTHLRESLLSHAPIDESHIHAMPVTAENPAIACQDYAKTLNDICGDPACIDLTHLGMGADGHTASLVPGDPVCNKLDADVALTGLYQKRRRMTLTYPIINRSRKILWVVTGTEKKPVVPLLMAKDPSIPAGSVEQSHAILLLDAEAVG